MEKLTKAQEKLQDAISAHNNGEYDGFASTVTQDYPDKGYRGEWLHINERGNCVLYFRNARGKDREIASCV